MKKTMMKAMWMAVVAVMAGCASDELQKPETVNADVPAAPEPGTQEYYELMIKGKYALDGEKLISITDPRRAVLMRNLGTEIGRPKPPDARWLEGPILQVISNNLAVVGKPVTNLSGAVTLSRTCVVSVADARKVTPGEARRMLAVPTERYSYITASGESGTLSAYREVFEPTYDDYREVYNRDILAAQADRVVTLPPPMEDLPPKSSFIPESYRLDWFDEFNGTALDATKWGPYFEGSQGDGFSGNDAVSVADGLLTITTYTAGGRHFTGMLTTRGKVERRLGYYEARIRFATAPGVVSAFGIEAPGQRGMKTSSTHTAGRSSSGTTSDPVQTHNYTWRGPTQTSGSGFSTSENTRLAEGFHVFGFEVTENASKFFVDGKPHGAESFPVSLDPLYVILASEVCGAGSSKGQHIGSRFNKPSEPIPGEGYGTRETSTAKMVVDYVRCYERSDGGISSPRTSGDYTYFTKGDGSVVITGFNRNYLGALCIPVSLDGSPVTEIGSLAFEQCGGLSSVTIPEGVLTVGERAFSRCYSLTNVTILSNVSRLINRRHYNSPFSQCDNLKAIHITPDNTTYSSEDGVLFDKNRSTLLYYPPGKRGVYAVPPGVTTLEYPALWHLEGLTQVTIPGSVTNINNAMSDESARLGGLTNVTADSASATFSSVDGVLFDKARKTLVLVPRWRSGHYTIPEGVSRIRSYAFSSCTSLESITIPASVTDIEDSAFSCCSHLTALLFEGDAPNATFSATASINKEATLYYRPNAKGWGEKFGNRPTALYRGGIADGVSPSQAQMNNMGIGDQKSMMPPTGHSEIGKALASNLTPPSVPDTPTNAFTYLEHDGTITILKYKGADTEVRVPSAIGGLPVTSLGEWAFANCKNLTRVLLPDTVTHIASHDPFIYCIGITSFHVDTDNPVFWADEDGVLFSKDKTRLVNYPHGKIGGYAIPDGVVEIGDSAFRTCAGLTDIAIPESVTKIGEGAFWDCAKLTACEIPSRVTDIGDYAFRNCTRLRTIVIPDHVDRIGKWAFTGCSELTDVRVGARVTSIGWHAFGSCYNLTNVVLSESLTEIERGVFSRCIRLPNITIPENVTQIREDLFFNCDSLTKLVIPGSVTNMGASAFLDCSNLKAVYFKGDAPAGGQDVSLFSGSLDTTVYHRPGTKGWGETFGGRATREWKP